MPISLPRPGDPGRGAVTVCSLQHGTRSECSTHRAPAWAGEPRRAEGPGMRAPPWPSVPALGPGLPLGLQSKTRPRPQGAHGLAGVLSDRSTRDLRARWGQPGRCLWRRHLAAIREAGAWGRGQPHGNTWWPPGPAGLLGLAGRWARGGAGRGLPPGPTRRQAGPAHLRTPGGCS